MGFVISKVIIQNLKYITCENALEIIPEKADMVILNGQNGYGKTTFFDALELLFTSKKEYMTSVANRQTVNVLEELAFDKNKDIDITVILENEDGIEYVVRRVFEHANDFASRVYCNNKEIKDEDLHEKLGYANNAYGMGIYMSQTKSLSFLEKKVKDRKSVIAQLVNTKEASDKTTLISDVSKSLKARIESKHEELENKKQEVNKEIEKLQNELDVSTELSQKVTINNVLFPGKGYAFDQEEIDITKSFDVIVEPLKQIKSFISKYDDYVIKKQNDKLKQLIKTPRQLFLKKYYLNAINEVNANRNRISIIEEAIKYKSDIDANVYSIKPNVCNLLGIGVADVDLVNDKIERLASFNEGLSKSEEIIFNINKARNNLISCYHDGVKDETLQPNVCPLCRARYDEIETVFKNVEESLISSKEFRDKERKRLENELVETFTAKITVPLNRFIAENSLLYQNYQQVKDCIEVDVEELALLLAELNVHFDGGNQATIEMAQFEKAYVDVITTLEKRIQEEKVIFNPEELVIYESVLEKYYNGEKPIHTIEDINNKIGYIANCYASESKKRLQELKEKLVTVENAVMDYEKRSGELLKNVLDLNKKYSAAFKDYQTKLVEAIRIPILIFSGKVIQNYPLGLGIETRIADNQLSFEPFEKEGVDVINILSTGQLNGLAISIMLAVRSVYGRKNGLDFMLIDDPLQTIDDISAISLVDLLLNSSISQVIISTHEDRKARMFGYKYRQRGLVYKEINMKRAYLDYKTQ